MNKKGNIILLNGPSSGGKTTLSKAVQNIYPRILYYLSYDLVASEMLTRGWWERLSQGETDEDFLIVMYTMAKSISDIGRHVIVDNCFFDTEKIFEISLDILSENPVLFVRVECGKDELRRREIQRGDREIGKAEWQNEHITPKENEAYDLCVNTQKNTAEFCAEQIVTALKSHVQSKTYKK